ncbi:isoprenyl transferase [[Clostridium] colinum]|uniref:isoprenyl transferase n=1 Tax=[Clostridium] colinum TaxID=36835 RepID=UPI002023BCC3|nr:isoprenyl transferase [[Clostridium] colinum]
MERALPKHIAIIMDGNGRWAKKRFLPKKMGHKAGADTLKKLLEKIEKTEIEHVTVYAFSTENWKRDKEEVDDLMRLLKDYIGQYIKDNEKGNLKIDTIGDISVLNEDLQKDLAYLKEISSKKTGLNLHIALNYGGRDEIVRAIKNIARDVNNKNISIDNIDENLVSSYLDTKEYNDPELIIRTSGELRTSNFLIWQSAYSEFYFSDKLWPDFTFEDLEQAINAYQKRERRFGGRVNS